jgi:uncharacterized protein (DUF1697 family)
MTTHIALLRGINVGGNNMLPMKDLAAMLADCGCTNVQTYIQSGNAVFKSDREAAHIATDFQSLCHKTKGFAPQTLILPLADYEKIVAANPFPEAIATPKALHIYFLLAPPLNVDHAAMLAACNPVERFHLTNDALYIHTPDKLTDSALLPKLGKFIKIATTQRNWTTVTTLLELARAL